MTALSAAPAARDDKRSPARRRAPPRRKRARAGQEGAGGAELFVEVVENGETLDQHGLVLEDERGYAPERIVPGETFGVGPHRPRHVLEGDAVVDHRDRDASYERGIELTDQ